MRHLIATLLAFSAVTALQAATTSSETSGALFSDSIVVIGEPVYLVPIPQGKAFEVSFKVGELQIEARPVFDARLEIHATCKEVSEDFCRRRVARLTLKTTDLDDRVRVELTGMSRREMKKLGVEATIVVPERAPLIVKMGIGELEIDAGLADLDVGMSIGDLTVDAPSDRIAVVGITTRIGDASLETKDDFRDGRRKMLLGAKLQWDEGPGDSSIAVKLGIGDAKVRLH
jgi:hypothetical protein